MGKFILKGSLGTVDIIELHGILLEKNTVELRDKLFERLKQGITDLVMLCEQFKQIDSTGISLFIEISDHLQARGGKLHLVACPLSVMIPMKSLGMVNFFQFYKTEQEALSALKITPEEVGKVVSQKTAKVASQTKRQVAIKDHVRNKMILFKHYENATAKDIILYLQSTYAHFKEKEIELALQGKRIPQDCTLKQLFEEYNYDPKAMIDVEEVMPEPSNLKAMIKRGGKLYDQAILEILVQKNCLDQDLASSVKQIADLNQETVTTTLLEGEYLSEKQILQAVGGHFGWETVESNQLRGDSELLQVLPRERAKEHCVLPVRQEGQKLWVAMSNPLDEKRISTLATLTNCEIVPLFSPEFILRQKLEEEALHEPEEKPEASPGSYKETGYFSVDSFVGSHNIHNLQEYSLATSLPAFLEDSLLTLRKLQQSWEVLQKFAQQIYAKNDLDSVLSVILDMLVSVVPIEHGIFLLDLEGTGDLSIRKLPGLPEYQSLSEQAFHEIASYALISKAKEVHNILGGCGKEDHVAHLAIPFISRRGEFLGLLYLISPKDHGMYNMESIKPLMALFGWGATIIENEMLHNQIEKGSGKKDT